MTRTAIFVIYQKDNHLPQDVIYLLKELKTVADKIVIVVNGEIDEIDILKRESDYLIMRENLGFDAGAYKTALNDEKVQKLIKQSDELVFCNDTFYGPLVPFKEIFKKMDSAECDFWGLSLVDTGIAMFLQSNFLVFRKSVIKSKILNNFFETFINDKTIDINNVLRFFERKLFIYLTNNNYSYSFFCKLTTNKKVSVIFDKVPILRKKLFDPRWFCQETILANLSYIENKYNYPVKMILEDVKKRFGVIIHKTDYLNYNFSNVDKVAIEHIGITRKKIQQFISDNWPVFLYGTGWRTQDLIDFFGSEKIASCIVSDDRYENGFFCGKKVLKFSEIRGNNSLPIIVVMGLNNSRQVRDNLKDFTKVLYLWELN